MTAKILNPRDVNSSVPILEKRPVDRLLAPLDALVEKSPGFISKSLGQFESAGQTYSLPRYVYLGQKGGGEPIRIGIIATLHGDEPEGALALTRFVSRLEGNPEIAKGYALFLYPVCNPTGFEDSTRLSRMGKDLDREFWSNSAEPEVRYLESEIWMHAFDGIITLRSDADSSGIYGFVNGSVLSENLIEPALREAERFLPRNRRTIIGGFSARRGVITNGYSGALKTPQGLRRPPFEIILETPRKASLHRQVEALNIALETILLEYRYLIAIAQNI
jgi:murein peptide amidase A